MTKKILMSWMLGVAFFLAPKAHAYEEVFDKAFSSATVVGVTCSSGAVANSLNQTMPGFKIGAYRISNPESASVFIGYDLNVSTDKAKIKFGAPIPSGGSAVFNVAKSSNAIGVVDLFCKSADALTGARVAVELFGYR